jgi:hypothetical protein
MLYDPVRKFLFIHIWKTGGESVVAALRESCPLYFSNRYINKAIRVAPKPAQAVLGWRARLVCGQHFTAEEVRRQMPPDRFDGAFKFTFVRNPWDWQVSNYAYGFQTKAHGQHRIIRELGSFEKYIRYQYEQRAPAQCSFIFGADGKRLVDFVGRTENLDEDFHKICKTIGLEAQLPLLNVSNRRRDWRSYYTEETRALVAELFRGDLEEFGYSWED